MPSRRLQISASQTALVDDRTNRIIRGTEESISGGRAATPDQRSSPSTLMDSSPTTPGPGGRPRRRPSTASANEIPPDGGWGQLRDDPPSSPPARTGGQPGRLGDLAFPPGEEGRDYTEDQMDWHQTGRQHNTPQAEYRPVGQRYLDTEAYRLSDGPSEGRSQRTNDQTNDRYDDTISRDRHDYDSARTRRRRPDNGYTDLTATRRDPRSEPRDPATRDSGRRTERTVDEFPPPRRIQRQSSGRAPASGPPPPPTRPPQPGLPSLREDSPTLGGALPHRSRRRGAEISDEGVTRYSRRLEYDYPERSRTVRDHWAAHYANTGEMIDPLAIEEEPQSSGRRRRPHGSQGSSR